MRTRLTPVLAGCIALFVILLAPSATGAQSAAAAGTVTSVTFSSATLGEDIAYNVYLPAGYAGSGERYPVLYLLHGRGDSMSAWLQMKSTLDELIEEGEIPPTIAIMPDAPWSSRASYYVDSAVQRRGSGPARRDGIHGGPDRARRCHLPDRGRPLGAGNRRLLDGRLRRDALLARPSRPVRRRDRAQPGGLLPGSAERLQHARVRSVRQGPAPVRRADLQAAELSGDLRVVRGDRSAAADVHRGRRRRVQEHEPEGLRARSRLRGPRPLQQGTAGGEPDLRAPRSRRRPRLGRLGPAVRRRREVHLRLPHAAAGAGEGDADRNGRRGARRRRRHRRGGQRLRGDRSRGSDQRPAVRGRQGSRPDQAVAGRRDSLDAVAGDGQARASLRRRRRPDGRRGRRRVHERRPGRRARRQHDRRCVRRQVRLRPATGNGSASSACRRSQIVATRSPPTRRRTCT